MSIETKRKEILRLFDENIFPHIIGDLKVLDTIQPETNRPGCTVPTAMLILSSLDFIGFLLRQSASLDDTEGNIQSALGYKKYFPPVYDKNVIKTLIVFYRHGLMHSFYPRQTSLEIYGLHKSKNSSLLETISIHGHPITSLNVNVFSSDFQQFVDKLYSEIESTDDSQLLDNFLNSFKKIYPMDIANSETTTNETTFPFGVTAKK